MDIYYSKFGKKTPSTNIEKVKTANNKWRLKAMCKVCGHEKSTFIKPPEASEIIKIVTLKEPVTLKETEELHKPVIKKFPNRRIVTWGIADLWAADLVIMDKYAKENNVYKYILNVIDKFSKFSWSEPWVRKNGSDVAKALGVALKRTGSVGYKAPNLLNTDKGSEFKNKEVKSLLKQHSIKMYHTENEEKSAIVERFIRTINQRMKVKFEARQSFRWVDILQGLLRNYNRVHRTIGMKPFKVIEKNEVMILKRYNNNAQKTSLPKLNVGDKVRITVKKDTFSNKYRRNWTREIFVVVEVLNTTPVTYKIEALDGEEVVRSFYEQELQTIRLNSPLVKATIYMVSKNINVMVKKP